MKGYINKRAKIKYETTPTAPEITADYIAEQIGDSEAITDAIIDTIEDNARALLEGEPLPPLATTINNNTMDLIEGSINLGYLHDVSLSNIAVGDILIRETGSKWENVDPELRRAWYHLDTVTADGTSATIRIPLLDIQMTGEPNYQSQLYIFVACELAQGANDASFGVVFEFNETPAVRRSVGDITNGISASGKRYMNARYQADGPRFGSGASLWHGTLSNPSAVATGQAAVYERIDGYYMTACDVAVIELRTTTSGVVIPEGSKFDVWVYAEKFQV